MLLDGELETLSAGGTMLLHQHKWFIEEKTCLYVQVVGTHSQVFVQASTVNSHWGAPAVAEQKSLSCGCILIKNKNNEKNSDILSLWRL